MLRHLVYWGVRNVVWCVVGLVDFCLAFLGILTKPWFAPDTSKRFRELQGPGILTNPFDEAPNQDIDTVIIGSGVGGLTAAKLLSDTGRKVCVLEAAPAAGGCTHSFLNNGYEFDVGLHYVGSSIHSEYSSVRRLFDHVTLGQMQWEQIGAGEGHVFDVLQLDGERIEIPAGISAQIAALKQHFPSEGAAVEFFYGVFLFKWMALALHQLPQYLPWWIRIPLFPATTVMRWILRPIVSKSATADIAGITSNRKLQEVFSYLIYNAAVPPSEGPAVLLSGLAWHFLRGASFPIGGSSVFARSVAATLRERGSLLHTSAKVDKIMIADGHAVGVELVGGAQLFAAEVIMAAGVRQLYHRLLRTCNDPAVCRIRERIGDGSGKVKPSECFCSLYLGLDGSSEELQLPSSNLWDLPPSQDAAYSSDEAADVEEFALNGPAQGVFVTFGSAKDPSYARRNPDKSTCELIFFVPYRLFAPWQSAAAEGKLPREYYRIKELLQTAMEERVYRLFPTLRGRVVERFMSTPLTNNFYLSVTRGECLGLRYDSARLQERWLGSRTPIKSLFVAGHDSLAPGIVPSAFGGAVCAATVDARCALRLGGLMLGKML